MIPMKAIPGLRTKAAGQVQQLFNYLFGYDIFVSYSRGDARKYAARLYEQLAELNYSCFLDTHELPSGKRLESSLKSALDNSKTMVFIGSELAFQRDYIKLEFAHFAATGRDIIPISVGGSMERREILSVAPWHTILEHQLVYLEETAESVEKGIPSPEIYEGIQQLFRFTKRNVRRRTWASVAALLTICASLLAMWQAGEAKFQQHRVEQRTAELQRVAQKLEQANGELRQNRADLQARTAEALQNAEAAKLQEGRARTSAAQAEAELRRNATLLYASNMRLAHQAFESGQPELASTFLTPYLRTGATTGNAPDLRGFEWYHLQRITHTDPIVVELDVAAKAIAYSPDGSRLAAGLANGEVQLRKPATGTLITTLAAEFGDALAFSPDGRLLATGNSGVGVTLRDAVTLKQIRVLAGNAKDVYSILFSPDGRQLAMGDTSGNAELWNLDTGLYTTLPGTDYRWILSMAFSPDGRLLAISRNGDVDLWDVAARKLLPSLKASSENVEALAISPDGGVLATGDGDKLIRLWDLKSQPPAELAVLKGHTDSVSSLRFSPDGKILASGAREVTTNGGTGLKLWDTASKEELISFNQPLQAVESIAFSPNGKTLTVSGSERRIYIWDLSIRQELARLRQPFYVWSVAYSPAGRLLAVSGVSAEVALWDTATREQVATLQTEMPRGIRALAFSPDGAVLAAGDESGAAQLWQVSPPRLLRALEENHLAVGGLAFSPDGKILAIARNDGVALWDVRRAIKLKSFQGYTGYADSVAFSPDGRLLALVGGGASAGSAFMRVWDVVGGRVVMALQGSEYQARCVTFSPDGRMLAIAWDNIIQLVHVDTHAEIGRLRGHQFGINSIAFSRDGKTLASAGNDKVVKLWNVAMQQEMSTLRGHTDMVYSVAFSPDDTTLASGGVDKMVTLWLTDTPPERELSKRNAPEAPARTMPGKASTSLEQPSGPFRSPYRRGTAPRPAIRRARAGSEGRPGRL